MNILAFDTSLNKTYVALKNNSDIITQVIESTDDKYHSAFLIQKIVDILKEKSLKLQDINLIATNIGPGSFTGIRVGLTVARGISQGTNADVVGINSLELVSKAYDDNAICVFDARKNKAYVGNTNGVELLDLDIAIEKIKTYAGKVVSDTRMQQFLLENNINSTNYETDSPDICQTLLQMAENKYNQGLFSKWQELKPLYIQPPPIHEKSKK